VWAPANEDWYSQRKRNLTDAVAKAIQAKDWRGIIKFERSKATRFLHGARSIARDFVTANRL